MSYIVPTDNKWVTLYDVSVAIQEHTGEYSDSDTQYAIKSFITSNYSNVYLDTLNTSSNSIGTPYLDDQFVKWVDLYRVEYYFYIDSIGTTSKTISKDYYETTLTFKIYSYKKLLRAGSTIQESIPVAWHYDSSQSGWKTNTPTSSSDSATTLTISIYENESTSSKTYTWSAIQEEKGNLPYNQISITLTHNAKYGTIQWNTASDVTINSITTNVLKGLIVTGNFNDSISDSDGSDLSNIQTAITISSSESWVNTITHDLSQCSISFGANTSETQGRTTTITLTVNDPRLTLVGDPDFVITQNKRIVTHDSYYLSLVCDGQNSFGVFSCYGGTKNYTVYSYANEYYDGQYQFQVNIPYEINALGWTDINNTSMKSYRSLYSSSTGTGNGTITVGESPVEYSSRSGTVTISQGYYGTEEINVPVSQNEPCMTYTFNISPTSKDVNGTSGGNFQVSVTSYKVMNGHTESPIIVGYSTSESCDWVSVNGNSNPSALTTNTTVQYDQNPSYERSCNVTFTQDGTNEYGYNYTKNLAINQSAGFIYVYVFIVNGVNGTTSSPSTSLSEFGYNGGSQTISVKSYAEVHVGSVDGAIDHYEAISWYSSSCQWITPSPSSGNGTSGPTDSSSITITANAQSEAGYDNSRCCDITFTQNVTGNKVIVKACQEENMTGYTYTFYSSSSNVSFAACSSGSTNVTIYSYKDKTRNGSVLSGNRVNVGYSVDTVPWAAASSVASPSSSATTSTIKAESNSNNSSSRTSYFQYTQNESYSTLRINVSQDGAECQAYGVGELQLNIGNGYKTSETYSSASGGTTLNVTFLSPQYRSLCGISSNTKCDDGVESYKLKSAPSWVSSSLNNWSTGSDSLVINSSDVSSERSGTVVYTNGTYDASIDITQAAGLSYTYYFEVNGTSSSKASPNFEIASTVSFPTNGGTETISVVSYRVNSITQEKENVSWSASKDLGDINITYDSSGNGGTNDSSSITASSNTVESQLAGALIYKQSNTSYQVRVPLQQDKYVNKQVQWSSPSEGSTRNVSDEGETFTAYANTTGATYRDCIVTVPYGVSAGTVNGTGSDGANSVQVSITVQRNLDLEEKTYTITISC